MPDKLSFEDVRYLVSRLPSGALNRLADGPLPETDGKCCRACDVLEGLVYNTKAETLREWHDFTSKGYVILTSIVKQEYEQQIENDLTEEVTELLGEFSYARCLVIYFAAIAELKTRTAAGLEAKLENCDEPYVPDPGEQHADGLAEDAERQLEREREPGYPDAVE